MKAVSVEFPAPVDVVFAYLADPANRPAWQGSLRRTVELRRQRQASRVARPVGTIVPWPLPPALIIRQTSEVHNEVGGLLRALRR